MFIFQEKCKMQIVHQKRPSHGTVIGRVWELADAISSRSGRRASRKEVIDAFVAEGGNVNTAATQYYEWRKHRAAAQGGDRTDAVVLQMARDGRLVLPLAVREALGLDETAKLMVRVENGELRITPQKFAFSRLQDLVKEQDKGRGSVVDELLAQRRSEAKR
jgi:bifunctional DNA-binding transcriptional regulator/antitoxin component of YhaV-PrlF toxin-antitoxin module